MDWSTAAESPALDIGLVGLISLFNGRDCLPEEIRSSQYKALEN